MIEENDIDDLFRDGIEPYEKEPSDKVWRSIDQQLDKKATSRYRVIIFRLKFLLLLLAAVVASFTGYFLYDNSIERISSSELKPEKQPIKSTNDLFVDNFSLNKEMETIVTTHYTQKTSLAKAESKSVKANSGIVITNFLKKIKFPKERKSRIEFIEKVDPKNRVQQATKNWELNPKVIPQQIDSSVVKNKGNFTKTALDSLQLPTKQITSDIAVKDEIKNVDENLYDVNSFSIDSVSEILPEEPVKSGYSNTVLDSTYKKRTKERLSLAVYFSPDLTMNYRQDNDPDDDENEDDYGSEEVSDFSYNTGFLAGYDLTKNWSVRTGFSYSYLAQTIKPKVAYARMGSDGLIHYQFNASYGSTLLISDQSFTPVVGDSLKILSNSFQSLQILSVPVILKYQFVKNKFSFYAQAGLSANFIVGERMIIAIPGQAQSTQKIEGLNKQYLGGTFSFGAAYNPYKKLSIMIEPTLRGAITSINKNTPVITRPFSLGLAMGIGWHF